MEFPLSIATPITVAAERTGSVTPAFSIRNKSSSAAIAEAKETRINVRSPAECLLLARSQPITAARHAASDSRSRMEPTVSSPAHAPSKDTAGSATIFCMNIPPSYAAVAANTANHCVLFFCGFQKSAFIRGERIRMAGQFFLNCLEHAI